MYNSSAMFLSYITIFVSLFVNIIFIVLLLKYRRIIDWSPRILSNRELVNLTVVVPAYNEERDIIETIESIVKSNYPKEKLELIIIDDGSKDHTYNIVKKYFKLLKSKKCKIKLNIFSKTNGGAADAKNYGILKTKTKLLATLDGDSVVDTNALRILASYILLDKNVGAVSGAIRVYKPKNMLEKIQDIEYDLGLFLKRIIMGVESVSTTPGGLSMFRTRIVRKIGGFKKFSLTEDEEIAINLQKHGYFVWTVIDGVSYTKVPKDLWTLIKQRTRWLRGGLWNRFRHKDLISLEAGDFSFFGMLLNFLFSMPVILIILYLTYNGISSYISTGQITLIHSLLDTFTILMVAMLILSGSWVMYALKIVQNKIHGRTIRLKRLPIIIIYTFLYGYFWMFVWLNVIITEIREGGKYSWGTR